MRAAVLRRAGAGMTSALTLTGAANLAPSPLTGRPAIELAGPEVFEAGNVFLDNPMETPFIPNWSRVQAADPDILRKIRQAVSEDNAGR